MISSSCTKEDGAEEDQSLHSDVRKLVVAVSVLERSMRTVISDLALLRTELEELKKEKASDDPAGFEEKGKLCGKRSAEGSLNKTEGFEEGESKEVPVLDQNVETKKLRTEQTDATPESHDINTGAVGGAQSTANLAKPEGKADVEKPNETADLAEDSRTCHATVEHNGDNNDIGNGEIRNRPAEELYEEAIKLRDGTGCEMNVVEAVSLLQEAAGRGHIESMLALATIYFEGQNAKRGTRHEHRRAALGWWDEVLSRDGNNVDALCRKGQALFQVDKSTPSDILEEAFHLFSKAASLGSLLGKYLKGSWLVMMAPSHGDAKLADEGKRLVEEAAEQGLSKAYVFLGHCYEFPENYKPAVFDKPANLTSRERLILSLYGKAAEMGDPDGLNDLGSCYATGYGGAESDFEKAADCYERAIVAGSRDAYDNLGTHYETGMNGLRPDCIDVQKALECYRLGAKRNCPKCARNLGIAYDDGMKGKDGKLQLERDLNRAEGYYKLAIALAVDANDSGTLRLATRDLVSVYITMYKLSSMEGAEAEKALKRLRSILKGQEFDLTMFDVDIAIKAAVRGNQKPLEDMLGDENSRAIASRAVELTQRALSYAQLDAAEQTRLSADLKQMFGSDVPEELFRDKRVPKIAEKIERSHAEQEILERAERLSADNIEDKPKPSAERKRPARKPSTGTNSSSRTKRSQKGAR